jgi:hypothetical protein
VRRKPDRKQPSQPRVITLEEQRAAVEMVGARFGPDDGEAWRRHVISKVWRAATPHELWKATGGLAGEKRRGDWHAWRGALYRVLAIIPLGLLALWIIAWGLHRFSGG